MKLALKFGLFSPLVSSIFAKMGLVQLGRTSNSVHESFLRQVGGHKIAVNYEYCEQVGKNFGFELGSTNGAANNR